MARREARSHSQLNPCSHPDPEGCIRKPVYAVYRFSQSNPAKGGPQPLGGTPARTPTPGGPSRDAGARMVG